MYAMKERTYDYVVVGGGTAGVVVAARLAEEGRVALLEAGPVDEGDDRVLDVRRWPQLLGSDLDWDYVIEPQTRGNSRIRHSRARVLGGCSSHNSCIAFRAPDADLERWERLGASGWGPAGTAAAWHRVFSRVHRELGSANPLNLAFVDACEQAGLPRRDFLNEEAHVGAGRFALNVRGHRRQSSSVAYLHPLDAVPGALRVHTGVRARRLLTDGGRVHAVDTDAGIFVAEREIILSCGAFDSPRLLQLSGIGPADTLHEVGVPVVHDLPGVGTHLFDHPEGVLIFATTRPVPPETTQYWEAGFFARSGDDSVAGADVMAHFGLVPFDMHTADDGYPTATNAVSITPNVALARSHGTVRLASPSMDDSPVIDFRYFTDPDGYDERTLLAGIDWARRVAAQPALAEWLGDELAPGADVVDEASLSYYARTTANTVYHPAGTCRMGAANAPDTVIDPRLRVLGLEGLRVADASIFPDMIRVNPGLTCMMIGERCAELIIEDES